MAGNARYTVLLDACVLYPLLTADALMSLATSNFFAAKWTAEIEREWITALERDRPDLNGRLETRRDCMRQAVPDWEVPERTWRALAPSLELPDPNDVHVLAAAIAGHADCIVTVNRKDFPEATVTAAHGIEVLDPDTFIINQWDLAEIEAITAFKRMRARMKNPAATPEHFASLFDKNRLPLTAGRLREAVELI